MTKDFRGRILCMPEELSRISSLLLLSLLSLFIFYASSTMAFVGQQNFRLSRKDCKVNNLRGICMFVSDCIRSEGHHLGICIDDFMFGSCCYHNVTHNQIDYYTYSNPKSTMAPFKTTNKDDESDIIKFTDEPLSKPDKLFNVTNPIKIDLMVSEKRNQTYSGPDSMQIINLHLRPSLWYTTTEANFLTKTQSNSTVSKGSSFVNIAQNSVKNYTIKLLSATNKTMCGKVPLASKPQMRIVGGKKSVLGQWPWQVSVRRASFFGLSSVHRCGGALLNENWVVTAGHCVDDLLTSQVRIRIGEHNFSQKDKKYPHTELGISRKVIHPKYNHSNYEHDLALVKLSRSIRYSAHINPICLPQTENNLVGLNATVTGWGRLKDGGILPEVLHETTVPIISNDNCKNMFLRSGRNEYLPDIFICAGHENGGRDSCQGDSGGPLQIKNPSDGRYYLAGIISWGIGCAEANLPGICTRISKFVPWIFKNVI